MTPGFSADAKDAMCAVLVVMTLRIFPGEIMQDTLF